MSYPYTESQPRTPLSATWGFRSQIIHTCPQSEVLSEALLCPMPWHRQQPWGHRAPTPALPQQGPLAPCTATALPSRFLKWFFIVWALWGFCIQHFTTTLCVFVLVPPVNSQMCGTVMSVVSVYLYSTQQKERPFVIWWPLSDALL